MEIQIQEVFGTSAVQPGDIRASDRPPTHRQSLLARTVALPE
jgi:hypothetical protein